MKPRALLKPLFLAAVIFFTVSGGPYGLEPLLSFGGKGGALLLLLITPLCWDIPTILAVLELNSMMPVNGGYYQWVKKALGLRWGFYEGWWSWLYSFTDLAVYPVLFSTYAIYLLPGLAPYRVELSLAVVWISAVLNVVGIVPVGRISLILSAIVLIPFVLLFTWGAPALWHGSAALGHLSLKGVGYASVSLGLYTVMWNLLGWDNITTYAGEVERPVRAYGRSMVITFFLVIVIYMLCVFTALGSGIDFSVLKEQGFPALGELIGGHWLAILLSVGGMACALGLFSGVLLSVSRVPDVMGEDRLLPAWFAWRHPRFGTPVVSIVVSALAVSGMVFWNFDALIVIDIILYGAGLFLEFIALVVLRLQEPRAHRPFRIPLGVPGLCLLFLLPVAVYGIALTGALSAFHQALDPVLFALYALGTAEVAWFFVRLKRKSSIL